ncbi:MAG: MTH1187 family thiamine-binding protein [Myxococcota bacterium]
MSKDKSVLLEFSMSPLDKGESLSKYVSRSLDIIDKSGLEYRVNPMGTVIEGSWEECFAIVNKCFERMREDCNRINVIIKVDYRKGKSGRLSAKVESLEKHLGKNLKQ